MPLNPATLALEIRKISDPTAPGFGGFPANTTEVGQRWAAAAKAFWSEMVFPPLIPGTLDAAAGAMAAFLSLPGAGPFQLAQGLQAFAAALTLGISPQTRQAFLLPEAPPYDPTLPPSTDATVPATTVATAIYTWAITGLAGPLPAGPVIPWS